MRIMCGWPARLPAPEQREPDEPKQVVRTVAQIYEALSFTVDNREICFNVSGNPSAAEKERLIEGLKKYPLAALRSWSEGVIGPDGMEIPLTIHFVQGSEYAQALMDTDGVPEASAKDIAQHAIGSYSTIKNSLWLNRGCFVWGHYVQFYTDNTILHELGHALDDFLVQRTADGVEVGEFTTDTANEALKFHKKQLNDALNAAGTPNDWSLFFVSEYAFSGDKKHRGENAFCEYFAESIATFLEGPIALQAIDQPLATALEKTLDTLKQDDRFNQGHRMEAEQIFKNNLMQDAPPAPKPLALARLRA